MVVGTKPGLAAVGSATVAVLSQSSGIAAIFAMRRGHVVYNTCALYMLLYKQQCRGFYCCSKRVSSKREVCVIGTSSSLCVWRIYTSGTIVIVHALSIDLRNMYV